MSVVDSLRAELEALGPRGAGSTLAATALALAAELDADNSATSKSMCAKSMVDVLRELRVLAPPKPEVDNLDDLTARRMARRSAATAHSARP